MERVVLGLDIGGANLKAATCSGRAKSVPFAVWKHPDKLSAELRKLIRAFPDASELAVTMTAELCDCYETKREGVRRIIEDVQVASKLPMKVWSTEGKFVAAKSAMKNYMNVAAANWHAAAMLIGQQFPKGVSILVDCGTTTTDITPIVRGRPWTLGLTDRDRLNHRELVYTGWRRTPCMAGFASWQCREYFATAHDVHLILGNIAEDSSDCDTADGRPATKRFAHARLARMQGGDGTTISRASTTSYARIMEIGFRGEIRFALMKQIRRLRRRFKKPIPLVIAGSGAFLVTLALLDPVTHGRRPEFEDLVVRQLNHEITADVSSCLPAYAVAVLAAEQL